MNVTEFFGSRLPEALKANAAFKTCKGTVAIIVEGAGSWTVQLGNVKCPVVDDIDVDSDDEADLICIWTVPAFEALLAGSRNLDDIAPTALIGDEKLLVRLGSLLQPAQKGGVGARLASLAA